MKGNVLGALLLWAQSPEHFKWQDFGLLGVVLGATSFLVWSIISWFQSAMKEQRTDFIAALKVQQDTFTAALKTMADNHDAELAKHENQVKEWRKEQIEESRATRDMIQVFVGKLALITIGEREHDSPQQGGRNKPGGSKP